MDNIDGIFQQMLDGIKHFVDDNFVIQQDSAPQHQCILHATLQLLWHETLSIIFPEL